MGRRETRADRVGLGSDQVELVTGEKEVGVGGEEVYVRVNGEDQYV